MTDERLNKIHEELILNQCAEYSHATELIDEIKQLRIENALLHKWLDRYKTPNVDDATFTWSEGSVAKAHRLALEEEVKS